MQFDDAYMTDVKKMPSQLEKTTKMCWMKRWVKGCAIVVNVKACKESCTIGLFF